VQVNEQMLAPQIEILDCFATGGGPLTAAEVIAMAQVPRSTVFRSLRALAACGFLVHDQRRRQYLLGPRVLRLGLAARAQLTSGELVAGPLHELAAQTGETVTFNILDLPQRTIAYVVGATSELRFEAIAGERYPLTVGAAGKAILAYLPADTVRAVIIAAGLTKEREAQLESDLADTRESGFVVTRGERVAGAVAIAAPVWAGGYLFGSVTVVGPASRAGQTIGDHRDAVLHAAREIGLRLSVDGARPVAPRASS
jgi:DNA-binding IclR family transcriptional regulator